MARRSRSERRAGRAGGAGRVGKIAGVLNRVVQNPMIANIAGMAAPRAFNAVKMAVGVVEKLSTGGTGLGGGQEGIIGRSKTGFDFSAIFAREGTGVTASGGGGASGSTRTKAAAEGFTPVDLTPVAASGHRSRGGGPSSGGRGSGGGRGSVDRASYDADSQRLRG